MVAKQIIKYQTALPGNSISSHMFISMVLQSTNFVEFIYLIIDDVILELKVNFRFQNMTKHWKTDFNTN